jgi:hypothetical protein
MRLERSPVDHIDRSLEQAGDVTLHADAIEDRDVRIGVEFDQNIDVAVGPVVATRDRAEQGGVANAPGAQGGLRLTKNSERVLHVHVRIITETGQSLTRIGFAVVGQSGERLVAETVPAPPSKDGPQAPVILTILVCYAFGAAIGALASESGASALFGPAAVLAAAVLLPERWTGLAAQRH